MNKGRNYVGMRKGEWEGESKRKRERGLYRVENYDHNQHKSFTLVTLSDNTIVYYRVKNWTDCH